MEFDCTKYEPLITVIMPVRDNEKLMPKAVESVLNQSFSDWELIIAEGRSSDGTAALADKYALEDGRIKAVHIDEWMYESTNQAMGMALGSYVTVLNSDDLLMQGALELAAKYICAYDVDAFLFAVSNVDCDKEQNVFSRDDETVLGRMPREFVFTDADDVKRNWVNLLYSGLVNNQLNVYRKALAAAVRFRNDIYAADYFFNLEMLPHLRSVAYFPQICYQFNNYRDAGSLNASVGKYYDYQHRMFNDFYNKGIEIFSDNNCMNDRAMQLIRQRRMVDFFKELDSYSYPECPLEIDERLGEMERYAEDIRSIFEDEGAGAVLDEAVLNARKKVMGLRGN